MLTFSASIQSAGVIVRNDFVFGLLVLCRSNALQHFRCKSENVTK